MMFLKKYSADEIIDVKKIGVIMFGLMGDTILRTPVLKALKQLYPEAKIIVMVDPIGKSVLEYNKHVDKIIVFDRKKEKNKFKQNINKFKAILQVRSQHFDLLVNLYNAGVSRPMVFFSAARYKLGFCLPANKYMYNIKHKCAPDRLKEEQSLYAYMISVVEALSDKKFSLKPDFEISQLSIEAMREYLQNFRHDMSNIYILNLAASKEDKILSFEKSFFLVKYIYEKYGLIPTIISNPAQEYLQKRFIEEYLQGTNIPYIQLKTFPLDEVAALMKLTRFTVTPDTGLMHLAMAVDTSVLTIFTYTHPIFVNPNNERFVAVYERFDAGELYQTQDISYEKIKLGIDNILLRN